MKSQNGQNIFTPKNHIFFFLLLVKYYVSRVFVLGQFNATVQKQKYVTGDRKIWLVFLRIITAQQDREAVQKY